MCDFLEAGVNKQTLPGLKRIKTRIASISPALVIVAAWVGAKQHAVRLERFPQLGQHAGELLTRNVEESGIGKNTVKVCSREIELQKVLLPHLAARVLLGHADETFSAVEADSDMAQFAKDLEITARTAAKIEDVVWNGTVQMIE